MNATKTEEQLKLEEDEIERQIQTLVKRKDEVKSKINKIKTQL